MQKRSMTLDILCVNKYKIKTKIIEIVTDVRHGLQKPPLDEEAIAKNKKIIFRNSDTRRTAGGGSNGGNNDDSKKTVNPRRVPPGPNDPKEKKFGDKNLKWCGKCGIWTYHSTDEHKTKAELEEEKSNKSEGANASTSGLSYAGATALNF